MAALRRASIPWKVLAVLLKSCQLLPEPWRWHTRKRLGRFLVKGKFIAEGRLASRVTPDDL